MEFKLIYHQDVVKNDIPALPKTMRTRIKTAIESRLATRPESYGKPMRHTLHSLWSLRVGDYRVIYRIEDEEVVILKIGHRRDVYRQSKPRG
jgi:mRNA interferase RelE/StbE